MKPGKIIGIGWNYRSHLEETDAELPEAPVVFLKPSSCLIGDGDNIELPEGIGEVHHELELALIIGKDGRNIAEADALSHVSHLAVFNDITARDLQTKARHRGDPWALSKGMDTFGAMSEPVPIQSVKDLNNLRLELKVNGKLRQQGRTSLMIFSPEFLVSYLSAFMTLEKGDIIITGTPEGVGRILPGDVVEAKIFGVGSLRNPVTQA